MSDFTKCNTNSQVRAICQLNKTIFNPFPAGDPPPDTASSPRPKRSLTVMPWITTDEFIVHSQTTNEFQCHTRTMHGKCLLFNVTRYCKFTMNQHRCNFRLYLEVRVVNQRCIPSSLVIWICNQGWWPFSTTWHALTLWIVWNTRTIVLQRTHVNSIFTRHQSKLTVV